MILLDPPRYDQTHWAPPDFDFLSATRRTLYYETLLSYFGSEFDYYSFRSSVYWHDSDNLF